MIEGIAKVQRLLERAFYQFSLGNQEESKKLGLNAISLLNTLMKDYSNIDDPKLLKSLSQKAIESYQKFKSNDRLSIEDKIIWFGSALNGAFFPPLIQGLCLIQYNEELDDILKLSENQQELLDKWIIVKSQDWSFEGIEDLYQDYLQDCSFVVALISLSRNNGILLLNTLTPHLDNVQRFGVKLHFNGCERIVEIGNQLPLLKSKSLFIKSESNPNLYWPALLEKAYLKVLGNGYDSKGSNASIDTYLISGWIPEFISSSMERPNFDLLWEDLFDSFKLNKLVLAVGTGEKAGDEYYPNHDYSVIGLKENPRSLIIKNPWNNKKSAVEFTEIFEKFQTLYINWNTADYYHQIKSFIYKPLQNQFESYLNLPQFHLKNNTRSEYQFFILLEKHLGFNESNINLAIYESNNGEKVLSKSKPYIRTIGNNSGFHLTKLQLKGSNSLTLVVLNDSLSSQNFTLHVYSKTKDFILNKSQSKYSYLKEIDDKWDVDSCGGNWSNQSYIKNPQYEIALPNDDKDIDLNIALFTKKDILINFQLFWDSEADKPFNQSKSSLIIEKYRPGSLIHRLKLKPRLKYKLIISTYDSDILEDFKLIISSDKCLVINKINTRLGLFSKTFKFNWSNKNRFKLKFCINRETNLNIHLWSDQSSISNYRPKVRASLFYDNNEPIKINSEFDDNLYGIWLQNVAVKPKATIILLVERFEAGNDTIYGEIGSDFKIELI